MLQIPHCSMHSPFYHTAFLVEGVLYVSVRVFLVAGEKLLIRAVVACVISFTGAVGVPVGFGTTSRESLQVK